MSDYAGFEAQAGALRVQVRVYPGGRVEVRGVDGVPGAVVWVPRHQGATAEGCPACSGLPFSVLVGETLVTLSVVAAEHQPPPPTVRTEP